MDMMRIEDRLAFIKRMHSQIMGKIGEKEQKESGGD